ncbi:MAG TPA: CDP-alcohol phosphatidyltransferase family protein [Polyangiaceae bacterium]|nr:CDP-alcohol phosphatidyltransferase family protein [Polyangiaceae bacterium]
MDIAPFVSARHWVAGPLSAVERVLTAAGPVLLLLAYFGVAGVCYAVRRLRRAPFFDEEIARRAGGVLGAGSLGHFFAWTMRPWWRWLASAAFPPNVITSLSLVLALGAGLAAAAGRFALGGWLFVVAGVLDFLDGRVARTTGRTTPAGAVLDSVTDRYVESALIAGLAWYYRDSWVLLACLLALTGSLLVPYVRARAESLGVAQAQVGFMQRPERVALLGMGTALSPILEVLLVPHEPHPPHRLAIGAVVLLGITSHATALQRLYGLVSTLRGTAASNLEQPLRVAVSNGLATLGDFSVASCLVYALQSHVPLATVAGCIFGALVAFLLARVWAFDSSGVWLPQLWRYAGVSLATAALNAGGVALLLSLNIPFPIAWWFTRIVVFATWSYPLQRDFVFVTPAGLRAEAPAVSRG